MCTHELTEKEVEILIDLVICEQQRVRELPDHTIKEFRVMRKYKNDLQNLYDMLFEEISQ